MIQIPANTAPPLGTAAYQDVFQHEHAMGVVGIGLLIGLTLFLGSVVIAGLAATKDAKRIQQARAEGKDFEKRTLAPNRRFIVPLLLLTDVILIFAPTLYAGMVAQHQTVVAMQANVKAKYGADLEPVDVNIRKKLMQVSSPENPEDFTLSFPDGRTGTYSLRFDKTTNEPFILNPDGSIQDDPSGDDMFPSPDDSLTTG